MMSGDLKVGSTIVIDGKIFTVVEAQHRSQPRLAAFIKAKLKNIETGQVMEQRFSTTEYLEDASIERKEMQYLYNDGELYYFMDTETYEQIALNQKDVEEALPYMKESMTVTINSSLGRVISVNPPLFVELLITECEPGVQGDSSKAGTKPAVLETGLNIRVPLFVNNGETIKVDTRTGEYVERVS
jgi:elongation factor P